MEALAAIWFKGSASRFCQLPFNAFGPVRDIMDLGGRDMNIPASSSTAGKSQLREHRCKLDAEFDVW